jgi:Transglycosylase SLT domain
MGEMNRAIVSLAVAWWAMLVPVSPSWADEVRLPLTLDYEVLRAALRKHLEERPEGKLELWRTADGCGSFALREATVEPASGRLKITGPASGAAGLPLFGLCWANVSWTGHAEIVVRPEIGPDWQLRVREVDIQLYDASRQKRGIATRLWPVVKGWAQAQLSTFAFDLGPPVTELTTLLRSFAGEPETAPLAVALRTIRPAGLTVDDDAVRVGVALDLPRRAAVPRVPEPALSPRQLKQWEARLDGWDGFLSFVVKDLAGDNGDPAVRDELLELLLDARREVAMVLARGPEPGTDAVREIFLGTWDRLRAIVRQTALRQQGDLAHAVRYVVFLAAGDALTAIDAAAPAAGLDFSADGLRRLAKSLAPTYTGDPLEQSDLADPRLQRLFRFRDPDAPARRPRQKLPGTSWHWLAPRVAYAAEVDEWRNLAVRLDHWVPAVEELTVYRAVVDRVLSLAAERSLDPDALDERFDRLFHHLVKTTAWQESCWRQFVDRGGRVTYLESSTGDVGLMQINARIWRGFFSGAKLRYNAAYNAGAGAEILQHLLIRYGTREARGRLENAARATYSAYQGGPARYRRYRTATTASQGGAVDRAFWEKYKAVAAGIADDHVLCLSRGRTS